MATHQKRHTKNRGSQELILAMENEFYGITTRALGDCRFEVKILKNNILVVAKCKGTLTHGPNKKRIFKDNFVLIQQYDDKYYIIHKYSTEDAKKLSKIGEFKTVKSDVISSVVFECDDIIEVIPEEIDDEFIENI